MFYYLVITFELDFLIDVTGLPLAYEVGIISKRGLSKLILCGQFFGLFKAISIDISNDES